ncbi:unnamed protein product [Rotaria sp. Silwood1]|nr:unnamed protein product [Rotaria sp. Silwood1]
MTKENLSIKTSSCLSNRTSSLDEGWKLFKNLHKKQYNSIDEEQLRRNIWEENVQMIQKHNLEADLGLHTFTMKVNQFADLTNDEFVKQMNQLQINPEKKPNRKFHIRSNIKRPASVATGTLEGQLAKKTKKLVALSEQQLVDCSTNYGNLGCNGGYMDNAYKYLIDNHGIDTNDSYPYEGVMGKCRFNPKTVATDVMSYVDIKPGSEDDLQDALATIGPIAVAMDASLYSFQFYSSGVYSDPACSSTVIDFSLLAVGYGTTVDNQDYYILKNQHTTQWGMDGYAWLAINKNNQCGIATLASYALI